MGIFEDRTDVHHQIANLIVADLGGEKVLQFAKRRQRHLIHQRVMTLNLLNQRVNNGDAVIHPDAHRLDVTEQIFARQLVVAHIAKPEALT